MPKLYLSEAERTLPADHRILDRTRIREHSTFDNTPYSFTHDYQQRIGEIIERRKRKQGRNV